jgi:hypothetical protein
MRSRDVSEAPGGILRYAIRKAASSWNLFLIPKKMHYIRFQLLSTCRNPASALVASRSTRSPREMRSSSRSMLSAPALPQSGSLPIDPDIFMHAFLDPQDHLGPPGGRGATQETLVQTQLQRAGSGPSPRTHKVGFLHGRGHPLGASVMFCYRRSACGDGLHHQLVDVNGRLAGGLLALGSIALRY